MSRHRMLPEFRRPLKLGAIAGLLSAVMGAATAQDASPAGWLHLGINDKKARTEYTQSQHDGAVVIQARAKASASLLMKPARGIDLSMTPIVAWRWRVLQSPEAPDIAVAAREDAAARLVFLFDGDHSRLPWTDRTVMTMADRLSSRPMPFATLMYVTSSRHAVGTIVSNPYTRRVKMLVVDRLPPGSPTGWQSLRRNLVADFRLAFGEDPGPFLAWGLMSDSDNTRSRAEAHYAEPRFQPMR